MKVSVKILSLLLVIFILLGISLLFLFSTKKSQQENLVRLTSNQYKQAIESLLVNTSNKYAKQVEDYTYWDDMCDFVRTGDPDWSDENLATLIRGYGVDQVLLIAADDSTVLYTYPNEQAQIPLLVKHSKALLRDLFRKRLLQTYFYDEESSRIGVIYAATIHPSNDQQRLSKPQGYFFMVKYWDTEFLQQLEQLSGSKLSVVKEHGPIGFNNEAILFYKELNDRSGAALAYLKVVRPAPYLSLNNDFSKNVLFIFVISAILLILLVFYSFYYLVGKPLGDLGSILKDNKDLLPKLKTYGSEYVQIAEIIEQSITTRQELEKSKIKAEESDRLKSAFLANISHEIRTPMNAIIGFSQILPDQFDDKEQMKECTDIISQRCQDLLDIVNSMIDMSRLNTGNVMIQAKACDLEVLFNELRNQFETLRTRTGKTNIEFNFKMSSDDKQCQIVTDFNKLKEIFVHLLSNAFKFTREGKIEAGCYKDPKLGIVFYVSDTGKGIPKDKQTKIFDHFTRLSTDLTDNLSGTGLGLSIVKGLVDLLEGSIWLESEPGKGSTFYFTVANKQEVGSLMENKYL